MWAKVDGDYVINGISIGALAATDSPATRVTDAFTVICLDVTEQAFLFSMFIE